MIKRFNPDFSLSISHELAYMRETPEGGYVAHGDYATLFSELEVVKAERDAQQKRAEALAVENAGLKESRETLAKNALEACNDVFSAGFRNASLQLGLMESTGNRDLYPNPIKALVDEAIRELTTPATDAALAAVRTQERADLIAVFNQQIKTTGLNDEALVTVLECREALKHAVELREGK